jgi:hypothetical protein
MANILPASTELSDQKELDNVSITFSPSFAAGESLVSLNISEHRPNVGITVQGATFSGQYRDSFQLGSGAIKVRLRSNGIMKGYNSFGELPPPNAADIFEFNAPSVLTTSYIYTVKLVYDYTDPLVPIPYPVRRELTKVYTQVVFGDYNTWANQLKDYVSASGHFPN